MWNCPLRECRTYSLLGFPAVKCWGFEDPAMHVAGNGRIHEVWQRAVEDLGYGEKDVRVGWLREGAKMEKIEARARKAGLAEIDITDFGRKPEGLRPNDYRGMNLASRRSELSNIIDIIRYSVYFNRHYAQESLGNHPSCRGEVPEEAGTRHPTRPRSAIAADCTGGRACLHHAHDPWQDRKG